MTTANGQTPAPFMQDAPAVISTLGTDAHQGLTSEQAAHNLNQYGPNAFTKPKPESMLSRIVKTAADPMLIMLMIAAAITLGVNITRAMAGGHADILECVGIFFAIALSVTITVVMEGRSAKAFEALNDINDEEGEIALCTLSAFNLGALENLDELENLADLIIRALDALLDYQDYPIKAAYIASMKRRSLGVGVINFAYYLSKNGARYSDDSALGLTHRTFEAIQYYLLKASNQLAREQGACGAFSETTYAQGILPIDSYKKDVDGICAEPLHYDWEGLRQAIVKDGLRNSTVTALMPSETSSQIANATNGIEPPRGLVTVKASKDGVLKQVVPDYEQLKSKYELLWQMPNNQGYLKLVAVMQKFVDQSISANTNYDPQRFEDGRVPMKQLLTDLLMAYKYGLKTLYYHNTRDGADDAQFDVQVADDDCASGACKI